MCWHQHIKHNDVIIICSIIRRLSVRNSYVSKESLKHAKDVVYLQAIQNTKACGIHASTADTGSFEYASPSFYWLPKLHKNPCGNRFIAASNACSTKPLSQLLTACLTWTTIRSVKNGFSITVIQIITINKSGQAECFDSYDFSTLYISIPHQLCKRELVMKAFLKSALELLI